MKDKFILDACCGAKLMWIDKNHKNVLYVDKRREPKGFMKSRTNREIQPDIQASFTNLPCKDKQFKLIVWDPPHLFGKENSCRIIKSYGCLIAETWESEFRKGFKELWRVLDDFGVLIFKFNDYHIDFKKVLNLFDEKPLFANTISKNKDSKTKWFCFMKIPK